MDIVAELKYARCRVVSDDDGTRGEVPVQDRSRASVRPAADGPTIEEQWLVAGVSASSFANSVVTSSTSEPDVGAIQMGAWVTPETNGGCRSMKPVEDASRDR